MIWIAIAVLTTGLVGFACFDIGVMVGRSQAEKERSQRLGSMQRHPSNHLRSATKPSILNYSNLAEEPSASGPILKGDPA